MTKEEQMDRRMELRSYIDDLKDAETKIRQVRQTLEAELRELVHSAALKEKV